MRSRHVMLKVVVVALAAALLAVAGVGRAQEVDVRSIIINPNQPFSASLWTDKTNYNPGDKLRAYSGLAGTPMCTCLISIPPAK